MIRKETYTIEQILPLIGTGGQVVLDGDKININSLRMLCFKVHGLSCKCGLIGSFFAKEKHTKKDKSYHLNLYAVRDDKEILMTKDHIIAKSNDGADHIDNLQTMCTICNLEKGNGRANFVYSQSPRKLRSKDKDLIRKINYLFEKSTDKEEFQNLIKLLNKTFCKSISTKTLNAITPNEDIKKSDTFHSNFIDIGTNVVATFNLEPNNKCKNMYLFNKCSGERLHIHFDTLQFSNRIRDQK